MWCELRFASWLLAILLARLASWRQEPHVLATGAACVGDYWDVNRGVTACSLYALQHVFIFVVPTLPPRYCGVTFGRTQSIETSLGVSEHALDHSRNSALVGGERVLGPSRVTAQVCRGNGTGGRRAPHYRLSCLGCHATTLKCCSILVSCFIQLLRCMFVAAAVCGCCRVGLQVWCATECVRYNSAGCVESGAVQWSV